MTEETIDERSDVSETSGIGDRLQTIILGGLIVGTLDGIAACVNAATRGTMPAKVFQYIASAFLGPDTAYAGGAGTILLGVLMHYSIALTVAGVFFLVSLRVPLLVRNAYVTGPLYGVAVYFAMGYVFVPLTLVKQGAFNLRGLITGVLIHIFCVGLPAALWARRALRA